MNYRIFAYALLFSLFIGMSASQAEFEPPRILSVLYSPDEGLMPEIYGERGYFIDKGKDANLRQGDALKVYREFIANRGKPPMLIFIGMMQMRRVRQNVSIGTFTPRAGIENLPGVEYHEPMKGDLVAPSLILDARLLFDSGETAFKLGAAQELDKIAAFIQVFAPSKLIVEGHTDSDGKPESNLILSERRAQAVRSYLVTTFDFITPGMVEAVGHGETEPKAENSSDANKALNRRIEFVVLD